MRESIVIGGTEVKAGQRTTINLPIARLYTHTEMTMPVHVVHGRKQGPCLFVSGAIHGDEINGVEIVRRLLKLKMLRQLHGTLIAIPIVNVFGFINQSRYLPDRRDLNRFFPGAAKGSLTSHLARLFMDEIVVHCSHGIDLHTGAHHRSNLPQLRACMDHPETARLARTFGAPVIIDSRLRDGSLREAVDEQGIPMLLYEAGEALRFSEVAIQTGLRGILAVMRDIGMLPKKAGGRQPPPPLTARSTSWVRANSSGILSRAVPLGTRVAEGTPLGLIGDPFGDSEQTTVSPVAGIVIGRSQLPLVHKGDALFHIATFDDTSLVESALEALERDLEPPPQDLTEPPPET